MYDELYGDCEDKKEVQSYGDQADEAFTDEEQRRFWEKVESMGLWPSTTRPWRRNQRSQSWKKNSRTAISG